MRPATATATANGNRNANANANPTTKPNGAAFIELPWRRPLISIARLRLCAEQLTRESRMEPASLWLCWPGGQCACAARKPTVSPNCQWGAAANGIQAQQRAGGQLSLAGRLAGLLQAAPVGFGSAGSRPARGFERSSAQCNRPPLGQHLFGQTKRPSRRLELHRRRRQTSDGRWMGCVGWSERVGPLASLNGRARFHAHAHAHIRVRVHLHD